MDIDLRLNVNGQVRETRADIRTSLLDLLRDQLNVTGPKKGCDHGQCGACTVLLDRRRVNSCLALAVAHQDRATGSVTASRRRPIRRDGGRRMR
jgi:xanthine dehydrogenase YagT iron-sulfur-binding subunit